MVRTVRTKDERVDLIEEKLQENYGSGTRIAIVTPDSQERQEGLIYGNDECIEDCVGNPNYGKLYQYFQPDGSATVYKCWYSMPRDEIDWSNIDYSRPDDIVLSGLWRCL